MTLFIDATVREKSRTRRLAKCVLATIAGPVETVRLSETHFPAADETFLSERDRLIAEEKFDDPLFYEAKRFASADRIVVAAPFWDLSFPAALKQYFEQVNVIGVTFCYTPEGIPKGLCRAKQLDYVTTAGGSYVPEEYGFGYVKALAQNFYGIDVVRLISATGLDIFGADPEKILKEAMEKIPK